MPSVTASTSASELVLRNRGRKSIVFQNEDATDSVFIKRERAITPTVSSTDHDFKLVPLSALALNFQNDGVEAIQDRWTMIASANTPRVAWFETSDQVI